MAVSEEVEVRLQDSQYKELLEEYRGRILPPEHPLTRQIQSVVTTILEANGRGILASTFPDSLKQKGINAPAPDVEIWDPDAGQTQTDLTTDDLSSFESYDGKTRRKWNLLVVADDSTINAMVVNGSSKSKCQDISYRGDLALSYRKYCRFYWNPSCSPRYGRTCVSLKSW